MEEYVSTAEQLFGPYVWGRYDVLIMPPSFPYGGMENPCLTVLTPCVLVGDGSMDEVIMHEIVSIGVLFGPNTIPVRGNSPQILCLVFGLSVQLNYHVTTCPVII